MNQNHTLYISVIDKLKTINVIKQDNSINSNINHLLKANPTLSNEIINLTKFINKNNVKLSVRVKFIQQNIHKIPNCKNPNCQNPTRITNSGVSNYCSAACSRNDPTVRAKYDSTCLERYDTIYPNQSKIIKEKSIETCQRKYHTNSPLESKNIQQKIKQTILDRYGVESILMSSQIQKKINKTNLEKYGYKHVLSNKKIHDKTKKKLKENFNVDYPLQSDIIQKTKQDTCNARYGTNTWGQKHISKETFDKLNDKEWMYEQHITLNKPFTKISEELNIYYGTVANYLHKHGLETNYSYCSYQEREVREFLTSINISFKSNDRTLIYPYELDFYIPEHNIAIEYNGNYWHSELCGKNKNYHLNKTKMCKEKGVQLIHILESEWLLKQDIIKSRLSNMFKRNKSIYARKCQIINVSKKTRKAFLNENHLQGDVGSSINYGLMYNDELVAIMTFGIPRFSKKYQYELLRFASKQGTNVVGGAGRLMKHFVCGYDPKNIITYGDLRYGSGNLYEFLGFDFLHNSSPNCYYFKNSQSLKLYSRIKFQKHKQQDLLEIFDPKLTAWENMINNDYNRIWDCGNSVWLWSRE